MICHSCLTPAMQDSIQIAENFVASDCQPVKKQLEYIGCVSCGLVSKNISPVWREVCSDIYANYRIYHQGGGCEQKVASVKDGALKPRSELLTEFVKEYIGETNQIAAIDIGCGNGAFLTELKRRIPNAAIAGAELNETFRADILGIAPDARFIGIDDLAGCKERFQLVTLIHCLEHIDAPISYLKSIAHLVSEDGYLLIEVPDAELNPFDLLIADHASHFSKAALCNIVEQAGFELVESGNVVLGKEITILARPAAPINASQQTAVLPFLKHNYGWLQSIVTLAERAAKEPVFGIFGSSIAASWFANTLGEEVQFFVDEDPHRAGRMHMGIPILRPPDVPTGACVFFGMEPSLAQKISVRYTDFEFECQLPTLIST